MGQYIKIESIEAPQSSPEGGLVEVIVRVKNLVTEGSIHIAVTGVYDGQQMPQEVWEPKETLVGPLETQDFMTSFTMPAKGIALNLTAWYYAVDGAFHIDDQKTVNIALGEEPPPNGGNGMDWAKWAPWLIGGVVVVMVVRQRKKG